MFLQTQPNVQDKPNEIRRKWKWWQYNWQLRRNWPSKTMFVDWIRLCFSSFQNVPVMYFIVLSWSVLSLILYMSFLWIIGFQNVRLISGVWSSHDFAIMLLARWRENRNTRSKDISHKFQGYPTERSTWAPAAVHVQRSNRQNHPCSHKYDLP